LVLRGSLYQPPSTIYSQLACQNNKHLIINDYKKQSSVHFRTSVRIKAGDRYGNNKKANANEA